MSKGRQNRLQIGLLPGKFLFLDQVRVLIPHMGNFEFAGMTPHGLLDMGNPLRQKQGIDQGQQHVGQLIRCRQRQAVVSPARSFPLCPFREL